MTLNGVWDVKRVAGLLPPLVGVRKRIDGTCGQTIVGPLHVTFDVRDRGLHYRAPFLGFVDVLEVIDDDHVRGRATFRGREFGRFELTRTESL